MQNGGEEACQIQKLPNGHCSSESGLIGSGNRVRLKCLASISDFYWKSAEITLLQEKPKFASVMTGSEMGGSDSGGGSSEQLADMGLDVVRDGSSSRTEGMTEVLSICMPYKYGRPFFFSS